MVTRIFAVIPAAGLSRRMGRPKLDLMLGGKTILERTLTAIHHPSVASRCVVLGPNLANLQTIVRQCGAEPILLEEPTADMRATVEFGLRFIRERFAPAHDDGWLLTPADHPVLAPDVVGRLVDCLLRRPIPALVVPTHLGQRGHPALAAWRLAEEVCSLPPNTGLNLLFRRYAEETSFVEVDDDSVLLDLDTPGDFEALVQRYSTRAHADPEQ